MSSYKFKKQLMCTNTILINLLSDSLEKFVKIEMINQFRGSLEIVEYYETVNISNGSNFENFNIDGVNFAKLCC